MDDSNYKCKICGNTHNNKKIVAREMMFGTKEEFVYYECANCKSIQIENIPGDLGKYYPENYNSFDRVKKTEDNPIKRLLKTTMAKHYLTDNNNPIGKYLLKIFNPGFLVKIKKTNVTFNSKILDVGSGNGLRLIGLAKYGFKNITGIDPFIEKDIFYDNGINIYKKTIFEFEGKYDMVMLNHAFEHMPQPLNVMQEINRLLNPSGTALIRIPIADSYSWKKYGTNWVALDPPRHLFLHTPKSIKILADKSGFEIIDILYDSDAYQFWGSEQYLKGIPMRDKRSYYDNHEQSIFSKEQIKQFEINAKELNAKGEGDAACFYLKKL